MRCPLAGGGAGNVRPDQAEVEARLRVLAREVARLGMLQRRKDKGLSVGPEQNRRLLARPALLAEVAALEKLQRTGGRATRLTVTKAVQRLVDAENTNAGLGTMGGVSGRGGGGGLAQVQADTETADAAVPAMCVGGDGVALKISTDADLNGWLGDPCPN